MIVNEFVQGEPMIAHRTARRRMTATLFLAQSLFSAAMIATFTLSPILAAQMSGNDSSAGLPSTLGLLGRAAAAYPIGWLMDRVGRRFGLSLGFAFSLAGMLIASWAILTTSFIWFLVGMGLFGMGRGASEQGRFVAAEVQLPETRAKAIGWIVFAGTIGAVGGPLLVPPTQRAAVQLGLLADSGPFLLGALLSAAGLLLIWIFLRPDPKLLVMEERVTSTSEAAGSRTLRQLFSSSRVLMALGSMTIGQLVMTLIMVITPLHMDHEHHGTQEISFVIMAHTLGMFGLSWLTGSLINRYGRLAIIFFGALILVLSGILAPMATSVIALALALFLLGLGWNFCFVAGSSMLSDAISAGEKGRMQGASEVVVALASGAGGLGSGAVFANGGMLAVSGVALAMVLALLAAASWYNWTGRTTMEPA
jgi:MFS family permease